MFRRLAVASLAASGLALAGCQGQAGSTCQFDTDCSPGLTCSNSVDRANFPRGVCGIGMPGADAFSAEDAFSAGDAFSDEDAFAPDASVPTDVFIAPDSPAADAPSAADAFVPTDVFSESDAGVGDAGDAG